MQASGEHGPVSAHLLRAVFMAGFAVVTTLAGGTATCAAETDGGRPGPARSKAAVVVVHGLNNVPAALSGIWVALQSCGYAPYPVRLSGHDPGAPWPDIDYLSAWRREVAETFEKAALDAPGRPVFGLGFSLGALLVMDHALRSSDAPPGLVLFSPPLALTTRAATIRLLIPFRWLVREIPSWSPEEIRAHPATSLAAYAGSVSARREVLRALDGGSGRSLPPSIAFISEGDEIVDAGDAERRASRAGMALDIVRVTPTRKVGGTLFNHLTVLPDAFDEASWRAITETMCTFLDERIGSVGPTD